MISLILVITLKNRKFLLCVFFFLLSGTYTGQIELGIFRGLIFCEDEHSAVLELCKRRSEGNKSPGGARPTSGRAT
jgi:hypothetical protein